MSGKSLRQSGSVCDSITIVIRDEQETLLVPELSRIFILGICSRRIIFRALQGEGFVLLYTHDRFQEDLRTHAGTG